MRYLEELARECRVELVLLGAVSEDDLVRLYNEALVVVCASVREPFGLVPLEAMACATPVVSVEEGGLAESVIDGQTGLLVERDPRRVAGAVHDLATDPVLARQLGSNGRQHVLNHWTWERSIETLERSLQSVSAGRHGATHTIPAFVQ